MAHVPWTGRQPETRTQPHSANHNWALATPAHAAELYHTLMNSSTQLSDLYHTLLNSTTMYWALPQCTVIPEPSPTTLPNRLTPLYHICSSAHLQQTLSLKVNDTWHFQIGTDRWVRTIRSYQARATDQKVTACHQGVRCHVVSPLILVSLQTKPHLSETNHIARSS